MLWAAVQTVEEKMKAQVRTKFTRFQIYANDRQQ
jgi:hypothetical protein